MRTKIPSQVVDCLAEFPVNHLSFSSVMKWHDDPSGFARQYVHKMWDFDTSPSSVVGNAVHFGLQRLLESVLRGYNDVSFFQSPDALNLMQVESLAKFERILAKEDGDQRVTNIDWGKTGSPDKSRNDILICSSNAMEAIRSFSGVKWIASEVRYDGLSAAAIDIPLPVSSVIDSIVVRFNEDGTPKDARVIDWKTLAALSVTETPEVLDSWDPSGKRRLQAGAYHIPAKEALRSAGYVDLPLTGVDFVEIHRGKGGASGKTWQILSVPYEDGLDSECVQLWGEMARRAVMGIFAAWFMPQFYAMPINLSSEYGAADAFKSLKDELANPDESMLTQAPVK